MKLIKAGEGEVYEAKNHYNCWTARKITPDLGSKTVSISYSHFLPNGGANLSSSPMERIYFLLSGSLNVKSKTEDFILQPGDMVYIGANEDREATVVGNVPATMMVIMAKV